MAAPTPQDHARLMRRATQASVTVAVSLALCKVLAWSLTGSVALLASLIDSLLDVGASLLTLMAVRFSLKPADAEHRFGHGKSEALAGLAQALLISASAVFVVVEAIDRFLHPRPLSAIGAGIAVMVVSLSATVGLVLFQRHVVRVTGSHAVRADALHYVTDFATNLSTIVALIFASGGVSRLDPVFGVGIAASTLYAALRIGWDTSQVLMDHELPKEVQDRIREIALGHAQVTGVHDLRTRQSGQTTLIQMHLEMDGSLALIDAHRIAEEVETALRHAFPGADVVIHQDPTGVQEARQFP
jgi:ferrous-iron efflux pump FieF